MSHLLIIAILFFINQMLTIVEMLMAVIDYKMIALCQQHNWSGSYKHSY